MARPSVRRVVPDPDLLPAEMAGADYLDAFEIVGAAPTDTTPEALARQALQGCAPPVRTGIRLAHRWALGLRLGPPDAPGHVLGWRVVESAAYRVRLEAAGSLLAAVLLLRRTDTGLELLTALRYTRPRLASVAWGLVGPLHRLLAPRLLRTASRSRIE